MSFVSSPISLSVYPFPDLSRMYPLWGMGVNQSGVFDALITDARTDGRTLRRIGEEGVEISVVGEAGALSA